MTKPVGNLSQVDLPRNRWWRTYWLMLAGFAIPSRCASQTFDTEQFAFIAAARLTFDGAERAWGR